jgi:branched-chain amino acid aminotransferase
MDAYLRLTLTRGEGEPGLDIEGTLNPNIIIIPKAFNGYPEKIFSEGISAAIVKTRRIPPSALNPSIKSLNFLNNIMARIEARKLGASEGIMLSIEGYVAEGTVCNIFIIKNGTIKTPPISVGILNGVTRSIVIGLATKNNISILEQSFTPDEIYDADECFVTSTLYEVMPVTKINGRLIGNGKPGVIIQQLLELFRKLTSAL